VVRFHSPLYTRTYVKATDTDKVIQSITGIFRLDLTIVFRRYRIMVNTLALHAGYAGSIPASVIARIVKRYNTNLVNSSLWFDSICRHIVYYQ
jgi:hypothetical protein